MTEDELIRLLNKAEQDNLALINALTDLAKENYNLTREIAFLRSNLDLDLSDMKAELKRLKGLDKARLVALQILSRCDDPDTAIVSLVQELDRVWEAYYEVKAGYGKLIDRIYALQGPEAPYRD